jgi:DNA helicase HerA-like ATPase
MVLEEAHSLIPEFNSVTSKVEELAVAGTARALLQGRKYGMGALVVTQRTANVTKSILNQCNTVFAMRVFDNTGMEFLSNYIGKSYSKLLAVMQDHHAVFFGRGSRSRAPVVIRLNHPDDITTAFTKPVPAEPVVHDEGSPA